MKIHKRHLKKVYLCNTLLFGSLRCGGVVLFLGFSVVYSLVYLLGKHLCKQWAGFIHNPVGPMDDGDNPDSLLWAVK